MAIVAFTKTMDSIVSCIRLTNLYHNEAFLQANPHLTQEEIQMIEESNKVALNNNLPYTIFAGFAVIANLAVIILITLKDLPVFKPLLDKLNARKQKRAQAKAERAQADKQAKIAELEAQLQELKKDDN